MQYSYVRQRRLYPKLYLLSQLYIFGQWTITLRQSTVIAGYYTTFIQWAVVVVVFGGGYPVWLPFVQF